MLKQILRGAGSDTLKYFPVRLVPALTSLITVPVFTHMVDKTDYGNFYLVGSITALAATLATAWITASVVRFYWAYERRGKRDAYVATTVWASIGSIALVSVVMALIVVVFPQVVSEGVRRLLPVAFAGLAVNYLVQVLQEVMRAANRSTAYAVLAIASAILATVFGVYFVAVMRLGAFGILLGVVVGNALLLPLGFKNLSQEGSLSPAHFSLATLKEYATFGFPMVPAAISQWVLGLSDRYIIGFVRTAGEVGMYSVAYGLGDKLMSLITAPMLLTLTPVLVKTFEKHDQRLTQQVQTQFTRYYLMVTLPFLGGIAVVAQTFMRVFTGPQYREAYAILPIVAASVLLNGLAQIANGGIVLHKRTPILMGNTLIAAAAQVAANLALVPHFGYRVAAWTTLGSFVLLLALAWVRSKPFMAWRIPWSDVARIFGATLIMALGVHAASRLLQPSVLALALEVILGIVLYALALVILRAVRDDERAFLAEALAAARARVMRR